ncbi:hypothetical protein GJ496_001661 [Pomphorhynchus laevis]|nr:hypothetical protein GJ496_001661 [Pomphorhynchus laevis]
MQVNWSLLTDSTGHSLRNRWNRAIKTAEIELTRVLRDFYCYVERSYRPNTSVFWYFVFKLKTQIDRSKKERVSENSYIFRRDLLPGARNIFYQLIDMHDEEIYSIVHSNDGQEPKRCHMTDGWCIQGYQDLCRAIVNKHHKILVASILNENCN